jgi:Leucine-rich repeat (LRR) protein
MFYRLKELWIDGNRIKQIPDLIGNLKDLVHLEASVNHIDYISGLKFDGKKQPSKWHKLKPLGPVLHDCV